MTVGGSKCELAHAPRLVVWLLQDLGTHRDGSFMKGVNIVHAQIRDVAVIAELRRFGHVLAPAEHEGDLACATEPPVARGYVVDLAAENVPVPRTGTLEIMNRKNWIRALDSHTTILAGEIGHCGAVSVSRKLRTRSARARDCAGSSHFETVGVGFALPVGRWMRC
jgi:hypothetical protein